MKTFIYLVITLCIIGSLTGIGLFLMTAVNDFAIGGLVSACIGGLTLVAADKKGII